jgi:hypothetical protein
MRLRGFRLRKKAVKLFEERDYTLMKMHESSMDEIHKNISFYKKILDTLNIMLKGCRPLLGEIHVAQEIIWNPGFENMQFQLHGYRYEDRSCIYKSEIEEYIFILDIMFKDYEKFLTDITVNAVVALTLLMYR